MSKASEWAIEALAIRKQQQALGDQWDKKPSYHIPGEGQGRSGAALSELRYLVGNVTERGRLETHNASLSPEQALAFAHWILDTFGEEVRERRTT